MSEFKSEILPSGISIERCPHDDDFLVMNNSAPYPVVKVSRADINRMHGIAFPEKRRSGECCNVSSQTDVPEINVGDMKQAAPEPDYNGDIWIRQTKEWKDYPIGTKAKAIMGGHWIKNERGWKWCTGDTFPTPGGDASGMICLPINSLE